MTQRQHRPGARRRRGLVSAAAFLLVLSGAGVTGVAFASQREAPPAPATADQPRLVDPTEPSAQPQAAPTPWDSHRSETPAPLEAASEAAPPVSAAPVTSREAWRWKLQTVAAAHASRPTTPAPLVLPRSRPVSLDIPSIGVHSVVRHLGQTDAGALETPAAGPRYNDAAWYRYSPTPGTLGPSILLGHVDSAAQGPSVFFRLGDVRAGDRVNVTREDGSIAVFAVDRVRRYAKDDFPTDVVYRDIDHAGLRILTCGGAFDDASGHYLDNIVVFASLVGPGEP